MEPNCWQDGGIAVPRKSDESLKSVTSMRSEMFSQRNEIL